jgi:NADH:ubiquinone oxidoreductase subunit F (NADH-binding)
MSAGPDTSAAPDAQALTGPGPRLLAALSGPDLIAHHAARGELPLLPAPPVLADLVEAAGLTGRGGAGFPTHRKLRAVARGEHPVVIGNGSEGEPASGKDRVLLVHVPHLVLDGIQVACRAVGASSAYLYVPREPVVTQSVTQALDERRRHRIDAVAVEVVTAPPRFIAGQESAAVARVGGAPALPRFPHPPVYAKGVRNRPTLVQNVETLAQLALLVRYGAGWFRSAGTTGEPGTMLFTVGGAVANPGVVEAPIGVPLASLLDTAGGVTAPVGAVLVGGYHGAWVPAAALDGLKLSTDQLRPLGGSVGAGVVAVLPSDRCGLVETARVVRYLAGESAGQCGPCVNGLPAVAEALCELAGLKRTRPGRLVRADVEGWSGLVVGRGACAHPDGTVRLVRSALQVFASEIAAHERGGCSGTSGTPVLPLPAGPRPTDWW